MAGARPANFPAAWGYFLTGLTNWQGRAFPRALRSLDLQFWSQQKKGLLTSTYRA